MQQQPVKQGSTTRVTGCVYNCPAAMLLDCPLAVSAPTRPQAVW